MAPTDSSRSPESPKKRPGRGEKNSTASFWTLIVAALMVTTLLAWIQKQSRGREVPLSEFKTGLEDKKFTASNVHEATFTLTELTFQDRPARIDPEDRPEGLPSLSQPLGAAQRFRVPLVGIPDESRAELQRALDRKEIKYRGSPPETEWVQFLPLIMMLVAVTALILFFRKLGGPGAAMSFGRSRGKLYADDDVRSRSTTWPALMKPSRNFVRSSSS